ncbi:hypothetical protein [Micromonospora sp. NPDC007230]|uniref:hypothetical protein n=1 Tax=Micromonospora sp. NPDC007230 TaxID=3364237 RepID=UPI0036CC6B7C
MRIRSRSARLAGVLLLTPLLTLAGPVPPGVAAPAGEPHTAAEDAPAASSRPDSVVALAGAAAGLEPAGGLETRPPVRSPPDST